MALDYYWINYVHTRRVPRQVIPPPPCLYKHIYSDVFIFFYIHISELPFWPFVDMKVEIHIRSNIFIF